MRLEDLIKGRKYNFKDKKTLIKFLKNHDRIMSERRQILSCMEERLHDINADIEVTWFGQEYNKETFAIDKIYMMIRGGDSNNMRFGDTLSDNKLSGYTFQYCIGNHLQGKNFFDILIDVRDNHDFILPYRDYKLLLKVG